MTFIAPKFKKGVDHAAYLVAAEVEVYIASFFTCCVEGRLLSRGRLVGLTVAGVINAFASGSPRGDMLN